MDNVARETLKEYLNRVIFWNSKINLIGESTIESAWSRHIEDASQISQMLDGAKNVVDVGSGAGIPGFVLSVLNKEVYFELIDSNSKKATFLKSLRDLSSNYGVHNLRFEEFMPIKKIDFIISRGFAKLEKIFELSYAHSDKLILHKGESCYNEIDEAKNNWDFEVSIHNSMVEKNSYILQIWGLKRK